MTDLSFASMRNANRTRAAEKFSASAEWNGAEWGNALAGEFGEVAQELLEIQKLQLEFFSKLKTCDTIKKDMRKMQGDGEHKDLLHKLAKELADVVLYADLLSNGLGIDLESAVREKFNEVSVRRGSSVRL